MRFTFQFLAEHCEEDCEIDRTRSLLQHLIQLLLFHIETSCMQTRPAINTLKPKKNTPKQMFFLNPLPYIPRAAKVSLKSFLSMKPSLFWSMMVKAYSRPHFQQRQSIIPHIVRRMLFIDDIFISRAPSLPGFGLASSAVYLEPNNLR